MCVCVRQNWLFRSMTSSGQPRDYQQGHRNRSVHVSAFWASKQTHDSPWVKHKHTHTPGGTIMTPCVCVNCKLTRTERGDIVRAGEVQRGPRDVHHVVIIVVTGEMKAIEAPVAVPRVLPHSEPCGEQRSTGDVNSSSTPLWATESGRGERQLYLCWSKNQTFRAGKCGCLERVSSHFTL